MTTLIERFLQRPKKGALQNRTEILEVLLDDKNGKLLVSAAVKLGCHVAQLAIEMQDAELDFIRGYNRAVPIFGLSSVLARKAATTKPKQ